MHSSLEEIQALSNTYDWLRPAGYMVNDVLIVRGSDNSLFPEDGPNCKYIALFDARPCFDGLRAGFISEQTLRQTMVILHSTIVQEALNPALCLHCNTFYKALEAMDRNTGDMQEAPDLFHNIAWDVYLKVLGTPDYYLSTQEMLLLAQIHRKNLLIVTQDPSTGRFQDQGHHDGGPGPYTLICLHGDVRRTASIRSHFERLFPIQDVMSCSLHALQKQARLALSRILFGLFF